MSQNTEKAYFAGGCFWCMEPPFEALDGVLEATSGYMGGETENPTYEQVSMGNTGHAEVVEIEYDPNIITYSELLEVFWRNIDPTALNYQFADVGSQYRTEIFTVGPNQMEEALNSKDELEKSNKFDIRNEIFDGFSHAYVSSVDLILHAFFEAISRDCLETGVRPDTCFLYHSQA